MTMERRGDNNGRRKEDECHARHGDLEKSWLKDICLAKKEIINQVVPNKTKVTVLGSIVTILLIFALGGGFISFAQSSDVRHNTEEIASIKEDHSELVKDVSDIKKDVGDIKGYMKQQTQILKALSREHGIDVDIE